MAYTVRRDDQLLGVRHVACDSDTVPRFWLSCTERRSLEVWGTAGKLSSVKLPFRPGQTVFTTDVSVFPPVGTTPELPPNAYRTATYMALHDCGTSRWTVTFVSSACASTLPALVNTWQYTTGCSASGTFASALGTGDFDCRLGDC